MRTQPARDRTFLACPQSSTMRIVMHRKQHSPSWLQVLLDGMDIRTLNLHWLRERLALVSQEPVLFNMTIIGERSELHLHCAHVCAYIHAPACVRSVCTLLCVGVCGCRWAHALRRVCCAHCWARRCHWARTLRTKYGARSF